MVLYNEIMPVACLIFTY